jgi:putative DNA primase/helicase
VRGDLTPLETALELLARGLWPVANHPGEKRPIGEDWGIRRPDADRLKRQFTLNPNAGLGVVLGPVGGVIDLEVDGPEGEASLLTLLGGEVIETMGWSSRRGPHRLFLWDERLGAIDKATLKLKGLPGLEVRLGCSQAQSVCPPTTTDGVTRVWNCCDTIAPLPDAAVRYLLEGSDPTPAVEAAEPTEKRGQPDVACKVKAPADAAAAWFRKGLENEAGRVALAREGERHATLLAAARTLGGNLHHGYYTEAEVASELTHAARRAGLPDDEIAKTIRDGLAGGKAAPLSWPRGLDRAQRPNSGDSPAATNKATDEGPRPWPPLRFRQPPPVLPFPIDVFPEGLARYCQELAEATLAPVDFVGLSMLVAAGAAIGQGLNIQVKRGWTEAPLLYGVIVSPPGKAKTPVVSRVVAPLREIDRQLREGSRRDRQQWEEAKKAHDRDPDNIEPPGPEPPQLRAIVKDITRESLVVILADNPRGVLCDPDEVSGWVASFNEYKGKGGADRQFWLSNWSSSPVSVDRKGGRESLYVPFPLVPVLGGLPPDMLSSLRDERGRNDGFLDRIIFCFPTTFPKQRWTEVELSAETELTWVDVIQRLYGAPMMEQDGRECPRLVTFTPEGKALWVRWFDDHADELDSGALPPHHEGAWSKLKSHAARSALILMAIRRAWEAPKVPPANPEQGDADCVGAPSPLVNEADVLGAVRLVEYFKSHLGRVSHHLSGGLGDPEALAIADWIRRKGVAEFHEADVASDLRRFRDYPEALANGLLVLTDKGVVRQLPEPKQPGKRGRKPSPSYEVHPDFLNAPGITDNSAIPSEDTATEVNCGIDGNIGRVEGTPAPAQADGPRPSARIAGKAPVGANGHGPAG